jgi:hypothetical protein
MNRTFDPMPRIGAITHNADRPSDVAFYHSELKAKERIIVTIVIHLVRKKC